MNISRIASWAVIGSLVLLSFEAVASEDDCSVTAAQRASLVASTARRLHNHDPEHAATMSKVASAIINGDVAELQSAIDSGLNANAILKQSKEPVSGMGTSLLSLAAAACQPSVAKQLIADGASVNGTEYSSPLVTAAGTGATSVVALLIQNGASVDKVDLMGHTALEDAVRQRHLNTVQLLLSHGGNPNHVVGGGGTILDLVSHASDPLDQTVASALRAHGAADASANTLMKDAR